MARLRRTRPLEGALPPPRGLPAAGLPRDISGQENPKEIARSRQGSLWLQSRKDQGARVSEPHPRRLSAEDPAIPGVLLLLRTAFAYMEGRIDPPSSLTRLTGVGVSRHAAQGMVWVVEDAGRPVACLFGMPQPEALYLGKLAVAAPHRGLGLSRRLIDAAADEARRLGLPALELESRIELTETHAALAALGFAKVAETAHQGFDRPTSITMRRPAEYR